MKMTKVIAVFFAVAGLLVFTGTVNAQGRNHGGNGNHGSHGGWHGGNGHNGHWHGGNVNFYFGGYPYYFGYPYWGYPYYGYAPAYGYGYAGTPSYTYDPHGIYEGRLANRSNGGNDSVATQVQQRLAAGGYYRGEIDGIIGEGTRRAIRNYKRDNNLPVDSRIDDQLLASMGQG